MKDFSIGNLEHDHLNDKEIYNKHAVNLYCTIFLMSIIICTKNVRFIHKSGALPK